MGTWSLLNWMFTHQESNPKGHNTYIWRPSTFVLYGKDSNWPWPKQVFDSVNLCSNPTPRGKSLVLPCVKRTNLMIFPLVTYAYHVLPSLWNRKRECHHQVQYIVENTESSPWHFTYSCLWIVTEFKLQLSQTPVVPKQCSRSHLLITRDSDILKVNYSFSPYVT